MLVSYVQSPEEAVAAHGVRLLLAAVDTLAAALDAPGWAAVVEPVLALAAEDPLQQLAPVQSGGEQQQRSCFTLCRLSLSLPQMTWRCWTTSGDGSKNGCMIHVGCCARYQAAAYSCSLFVC